MAVTYCLYPQASIRDTSTFLNSSPPMSSSKRARLVINQNRSNRQASVTNPVHTLQIPSSAYITAYEAQLVHGRHDLSRQLGERHFNGGDGARDSRGGLIKWSGDREGDGEIWLDR